MINIKNLSYSPKKDILSNVTLDIPEGKITVLIGENGSGKTTLFNSLLSLNKGKYSGEIIIDDKNIMNYKPKELACKLSYNFQIKPKADILVSELLELGRAPYKGFSLGLTEDEKSLINDVINRCGINDFINRRISTLSGGERQMVFLALSLVQDTKYIIFDEPDTYLDKKNFNKTIEIIKKLKEEGKTIIMSIHSLSDAYQIADRLVVLQDGIIKGIVEKEDFESETLIEEILGVKKIITIIDNERYILFK